MRDILFNPFYQVAAVALLVFLIILLISIIKKKFSVNKILVLISLVFIAGVAVLFGISNSAKMVTPAYDQTVAERYFAAAYAEAGDYETAYLMLKEATSKHEEPEDLLNLARLCILRESYLYAQLYYGKFLKENPSDAEALEEAGIVTGIYGTNYNASNNGAIKKMLEAEGMTYEEAGFEAYEQVVYTKIDDVDAFKEAILTKIINSAEESVKKVEEKTIIKKCAEHIVTVAKAYQLYKMGGTYQSEDLTEAASQLNRYIKNGGMLAQNASVRNATLIANTLTDDAYAIAKNIDEYATINEIAVAIELRIEDYVSDKNFKSLPEKPTNDMLAEVYAQCVNVKNTKTKELTKEEEAYYKSVVSLIKDTNKNYVVKTLLSMLTAKSIEMDDGIKSQMYMQLAKGYQYAEMDEQVSSYLDLAFSNASNASDKEYAYAMDMIIDYIIGDSMSGYDLNRYISDALARIIPVPMELFSKPETASLSHFVYVDNVDTDTKNFGNAVMNQVSKMRSTINIGRIDISNFPTVSTKISFGESAGITLDNIKSNITITDCGYTITNYTVSERKGSTTRVILMCDCSGSMEYDVDNLKTAIRNFAEGMTEGEEVCVVAFTSRVGFRSGFLSNPDDVKSYADQLWANGGTCIYSLIDEVASLFGEGQSDNNVLIIMTDGQDNYPASDDELRRGISEVVGEYGCSIYTIGLGEADGSYLGNIANYGNGQYLPVSTSDDLATFYSFVHSQVSNQYVISFEVVDQNLTSRNLSIKLNNAIGEATKKYSLSDDEDNTYDDYAQSKYNAKNPDGLQVYGFGNTYFYQSHQDTTLVLYGENFDANASYMLKLTSELRSYKLNYVVKSSTEMEVVVPSTIATGTYGLKVEEEKENSAGKKEKTGASVSDALTVGTATELLTFKFGYYIFTCENIERKSDEVVLSGNVILNGWLRFKDAITLAGNYDDTCSQYVTLKDNAGSQVSYSAKGSQGLTKMLASNGIPVVIPKLGNVRIYSDLYDSGSYEDFTVDTIVLNAAIPIKGLAYISGKIALYPDMFYTEAFFTNLSLDKLDKILKNLPKKIWQKEITGKLSITSSQICLCGSLELSYDKNSDSSNSCMLGSLGFYLKKFKVDINTINGKYGLEAAVSLKAFNIGSFKAESLGLKLGFVDGANWFPTFDSIELSTTGKSKIKILQTPVPMYLSGMSIGVSKLANKQLKDVLSYKFSGGFKLSSDDLIALVPQKVKSLFNVDKLVLFEVPDAKITVCLQDFNLNFSASLKFLGMQVGKCVINIGKFSYNSAVLNIHETEYGASAQIESGINQTWDNLDLEATGTLDVTLGYPASVLTLQGKFYYKLSWFIFSTSKDVYGDIGIGAFWNQFDEVQFVFKAYYQNSKGEYGGVRVDCSKSLGVDQKKY